MEKTTFELIYDVVKQIPKGTVATHDQVAALAGNKRWSRVVGYALHVNSDPDHIPCHRVVNRLGEVSKAFAFGGENRQIVLLEQEGVNFTEGKVDLQKYGWKQMTFEMMEEL
jgi:methylated-DNA-protein-cysteine methyltransferase-like protein